MVISMVSFYGSYIKKAITRTISGRRHVIISRGNVMSGRLRNKGGKFKMPEVKDGFVLIGGSLFLINLLNVLLEKRMYYNQFCQY